MVRPTALLSHSRCLWAKLSSLAVAMLRNLALVNVQKIPLFTCSRRLLADMSFPPGACVTVFTPKLKRQGVESVYLLKSFSQAPLSLYRAWFLHNGGLQFAWQTHSSTWLGGPRQPTMAFIYNWKAPPSGAEEPRSALYLSHSHPHRSQHGVKPQRI